VLCFNLTRLILDQEEPGIAPEFYRDDQPQDDEPAIPNIAAFRRV
jgi:hypothetical protein